MRAGGRGPGDSFVCVLTRSYREIGQAASFELSAGSLGFQRTVVPTSANWVESAPAGGASRFWVLRLNLNGYQAPTDITVWLPESAVGVHPPNAASNRATHPFRPLTSATNTSVLSCNTTAGVAGAVRRATVTVCHLIMLDSYGDPVKGIIDMFDVSADVGSVSALEPAVRGWQAVFSYTPPTVGSFDTVRVVVATSGELIEDGIVEFDILDSPGQPSSMVCVSPDGAGYVTGGSWVTCQIKPRAGTGLAVKGLRTDFVLTAVANAGVYGITASMVPIAVPVSALTTNDGGLTYSCNMSVPATSKNGQDFVHTLTVHARLASQAPVDSVSEGVQVIYVAHTPTPGLSQVQCARTERLSRLGAAATQAAAFDALQAGFAAMVAVGAYETVACAISVAAILPSDLVGSDEVPLRVHALPRVFSASVSHGLVSRLRASAGEVQFRCVVGGVVLSCVVSGPRVACQGP